MGDESRRDNEVVWVSDTFHIVFVELKPFRLIWLWDAGYGGDMGPGGNGRRPGELIPVWPW